MTAMIVYIFEHVQIWRWALNDRLRDSPMASGAGQRVRSRHRPARDVDRRAALGQRQRATLPDPEGAARHQRDLALQRGAVERTPSCG